MKWPTNPARVSNVKAGYPSIEFSLDFKETFKTQVVPSNANLSFYFHISIQHRDPKKALDTTIPYYTCLSPDLVHRHLDFVLPHNYRVDKEDPNPPTLNLKMEGFFVNTDGTLIGEKFTQTLGEKLPFVSKEIFRDEIAAITYSNSLSIWNTTKIGSSVGFPTLPDSVQISNIFFKEEKGIAFTLNLGNYTLPQNKFWVTLWYEGGGESYSSVCVDKPSQNEDMFFILPITKAPPPGKKPIISLLVDFSEDDNPLIKTLPYILSPPILLEDEKPNPLLDSVYSLHYYRI